MITPPATPRATPEGTTRFRDRDADRSGSFRHAQGLWLSSIGLGASPGSPDARADARYITALMRAVELGCNVIDSPVNDRQQRSERVIGTALQRLLRSRKIRRDEIVITAHGGYLPLDGVPPADRDHYIRETFVDTGLAAPKDIVGEYCMTPDFLHAMITQSRRNLGVECIDIFYLHNPETHLDKIDRAQFRERLHAAFCALEEAVDAGAIHFYGLSTWDGLRVTPTHTTYLSLADIMSVARKVRGMRHHCRFVQLPFNLTMPEALTLRNQVVSHEPMSTLEAAARLGLTVMSSAPLEQGHLPGQLPDGLRRKFNGLATDAQRCLQFVRSTPGVTTTLVGMSRVAHVEENLAMARVAPLTSEEYQAVFA